MKLQSYCEVDYCYNLLSYFCVDLMFAGELKINLEKILLAAPLQKYCFADPYNF